MGQLSLNHQFDTYRLSEEETVDRVIGNAYYIVKLVAERIEMLQSVAVNNTAISFLSTHLTEIQAIYTELDALTALAEAVNNADFIKISTDPNNTIVRGSDNGIYSSPPQLASAQW